MTNYKVKQQICFNELRSNVRHYGSIVLIHGESICLSWLNGKASHKSNTFEPMLGTKNIFIDDRLDDRICK